MRLVRTLGDRQASPALGILQPRNHRFEGTRQPGHDDELPLVRLDDADHLVIEEPGIRADPDLTHCCGQLGKAGPEQPDGPGGGMHVARAKFPVPEISGLALEAHQRMVREAPPFTGIVAQAGLLLVSIQRQHGGVQVEHHPPERVGPLAQLGEQAIVEAAEFGQATEGETPEEPAQRGGIGIRGQSSQRLEDPIVAQQIGRFHAPQSQDDRVHQSEQHLRDAVSVVALRKGHLPMEVSPQAQPLEEVMEQKHTTKARQVVACEHNSKAPEPPSVTQRVLRSAWKSPLPITLLKAWLSARASIP